MAGGQTLIEIRQLFHLPEFSDVLHLHALRERLDAMLSREGRLELAAPPAIGGDAGHAGGEIFRVPGIAHEDDAERGHLAQGITGKENNTFPRI